MTLALQILVLFFSFDFVYIWQHTPLNRYTDLLIISLLLLYVLISARKGGKGFLNYGGGGKLGIFLLNSLIFLLILSTGSLNSPLFFLYYLLSISVALILNPALVFILAIGAILILSPEMLYSGLSNNLFKIGSILLTSILAYFLKQQLENSEKELK